METVYIETTIVSYLVARPSRDLIVAAHQQLTRDWWETRRANFATFISQLVPDEAAAGEPEQAALRLQELHGLPLLTISREVEQLGAEFVQRVLPRECSTGCGSSGGGHGEQTRLPANLELRSSGKCPNFEAV